MNVRTQLIKLVTFLGGIYFFLEFVLPDTVFGVKIDAYHDQISSGFITVGAMAAGLGLINLLMQHGSRIVFRRREWVYSAALLTGLAVMIVVTYNDWSGTRRVAKRWRRSPGWRTSPSASDRTASGRRKACCPWRNATARCGRRRSACWRASKARSGDSISIASAPAASTTDWPADTWRRRAPAPPPSGPPWRRQPRRARS